MLTYTSKIIVGRKEVVEKKLIALQRKAKRMSIPPITYTFSPINDPVYVYEDGEGIRWSSELKPDRDTQSMFTGIVLERVLLTVYGESPVFDGWRFVAKLSPTADREHNLIMTVPQYENPKVLSYIDQVGMCEHCQSVRRRNDTYVVEHEDGTLKAVGKQCLASFVGGAAPAQIVKWGEMLFSIPDTINDDMDSDYYRGSRLILTVGTLPFLIAGVRVINTFGWTSVVDSNETNHPSTASMIWSYFFDRLFDKSTIVKQEDDEQVAQQVLDWMKTATGNTYMENLRTLSTQECVAHNAAGFLASAIHTWRRTAAKDISRPHKHEYYGTVGSRNVEKLILHGIKEFDGDYGVTRLHRFRTEAGHNLTWFASGNRGLAHGDVGTHVTMDFRVKEHKMYNGQHQTVISHAKEIHTPEPQEVT